MCAGAFRCDLSTLTSNVEIQLFIFTFRFDIYVTFNIFWMNFCIMCEQNWLNVRTRR